jgi:hypothetical protein
MQDDLRTTQEIADFLLSRVLEEKAILDAAKKEFDEASIRYTEFLTENAKELGIV